VTRLIVLYPTPHDVQEFEKAFREEHEPLVRAQLASVRQFSAAALASPGGAAAPSHWIVEMHFDSRADLDRALASDGWLRTAAHSRQISSGGDPVMLIVDEVRPRAAAQAET
jgi:uncharacterized protein (TIGR02118 family)